MWAKPLADGSTAVALFNRGENATPVTARFRDSGIAGRATVRDLWTRPDLGEFSGAFTCTVRAHGAVMLRVRQRGRMK